ncbi:cytochrome p450 [Diaporthe amygdali]|uniref:cytochrome p450 n=1 Tax=Phomopsis amygdali TaxID=1214568 RepID=UPI0022FE069A|nr:cytochrome p450 [Diaporthe amygdali]KAJ0117029.1 cytochrome p450 [Diaporthe amygdali]
MALSWLGGMEPSAPLVGRSLGIAALAALAIFFTRLYQHRTRFRNMMKKHDIPILPHSFLFGHLIAVGKALASYPSDFSKLGIIYAMTKVYPEICEYGLIYFDTWPLGEPTLAVFNPDLMAQFTQDRSFLKAPMVRVELEPLTDLHDIVTMEGQEWKTWRSVFNPGFSAKNLTALLPAFLEEIQVLKERLVKVARSGEVVKMEGTIQRATVDVIFRAALGIRLHSQIRETPFVTTLQNQIWWLVCDTSLPNLIKTMIPFRRLMIWNNNRKMKKFLAPLIEEDISRLDRGELSEAKTINYLAIKAYRSEVQQSGATSKTQRVDPKFLDFAISQLKIFIFAGHDTTASTVSFAYSRLYRDAGVLAKTRAEHDQVLGPDPSQAFARLTENPNLLNQMPYTTAVIKETLRLYPPAATARIGAPDGFLTHPDTGKVYPTDGLMLWSTSFATHRMEEYWERPEEFLPERWMTRDESDPLHPRKNAWRPFELGPRNCIGQELAQVEMRAILAMTVRELDIEPAYPADAPEALGEKAYQTMGFGDITGHVKDGFPVRVKINAGEK